MTAVALAGDGVPSPPSRIPLTCHSTCVKLINDDAGYEQFFNL